MATPVVNAAYLKEIEKARRDLRALIYTERCAALMLRLSFHDAGTYDVETKTGGPNGSIRYPTEYSYPVNKGLEAAVNLCEQVKIKNPFVTYADLYQLAGVVAVEITGGPSIDFVPGRKDSNEPDEDGRLPDPRKGASHLRKVFHRMGLSDKDIVVLSGGHTLGRAHRADTGFDGPWTKDPSTFDNSYFVEKKYDSIKTICQIRELAATSKGFKGEILKGPTPGLLELPTDKALVVDPLFQNYIQLYAADADAFFEDYAASHKKLSELGFSPPITAAGSSCSD